MKKRIFGTSCRKVFKWATNSKHTCSKGSKWQALVSQLQVGEKLFVQMEAT